MIEKFDSLILNLFLIFVLWGVSIFSFLVIKEPQIVGLYRVYPEKILLLPRESILIIPIAFSFIISYNLILASRYIGINKKEVNKLNFLVFLIGLLTELYIYIINF